MFCLNFGAIRAAGRMAQGVCCCLCLMICGGPILLIVGIVLLAVPNTRADDVKKYNTDSALFNPAPVYNWSGYITSSTNSYSDDNAISIVSQPVTVDGGSDEGVDDFNSVLARAFVSNSNNDNPRVAYNISPIQGAPTGLYPQYKSSKSGSVTCRDSSGCSYSAVTRLCQDKYGNSASATTTSYCREDKSCSCSYYTYLQQYCLVAAPSPTNASAFIMSTTYNSCYYPFKTTDDQSYKGTTITNVPFQLRLNTDPFIIMQKITKGDMNFGITAGQQRAIAAACIGIGCVMIACIALVSYILFKVIKSFTDKGDASQPMNSQYSNPQTPQNNFPPQQHQQGYPPQQQYPPHQPQPAYGQPAYGQPAPGYAQPAPAAYGQPAYGQPAGV